MIWPRLKLLSIMTLAVILSASEVSAMERPDAKWLDRVIPLPKMIQVTGSVTLKAQQVRLICPIHDTPSFDTAALLGSSFTLWDGEPPDPFAIRLALVSEDDSSWSKRERTRLPTLPNAEQAYAVIPYPDERGLLLLANTDLGLLYAMRTLRQLIHRHGSMIAVSELEIPLVRITDWPDLAERGQWGGNAPDDMPWTSLWKLNVLEVASENQALYRQGAELGVKVVPMVTHLEQIPIPAEYADRKDMVRVPDPSKPLPSDYRPSLCMSGEGTVELIGKWLAQRAAILQAFEQAKAVNPRARLRLLTTQGSYPVNDRILTAVPPDVGVTYYDGGRTYDSSRRLMIYPLLEEYARSGRWLGVYPQITHSWRTVFPWTGPQFIRFRAQEFVEKKLDCMIGYAVPSNRFHEFNVMAMAEWTWNSKGRSPEEFARAYATVTGICDPALFARWAVEAGEAGWSLAESNLLLRLIYDPSLGLKGDVPFDHRFAASEIVNTGKLDEATRRAKRALDLARKAGNADMIAESECALAGLEAFGALQSASSLLGQSSLDDAGKGKLGDALDRLDECAWTMRARLLEWGDRVCDGRKLPTRLLDTAFALLRTCDAAREKALSLVVADPSPSHRLRCLGEWTAETFRNGQQATLCFEISDIVPAGGGPCQIGFDFRDSAYGADITRIAIIRRKGEAESVAAETPDALKRVSRWERWCEMRVQLPARSDDERMYLEVGLSGPPPDAPEARRTCSGAVSLRMIP